MAEKIKKVLYFTKKYGGTFLSLFSDIIGSQAFVIIVGSMLGILLAINVIDKAIIIWVVISWLIATVSIAKAERIKGLPIKWRPLIIFIIAIIVMVGASKAGIWISDLYHQQSSTATKSSTPEKTETTPRARQKQTYGRPEFGIAPNTVGLQIITKAPQKFQIRIDLINYGEHTAVNVHSKLIIVDQLFSIKPISAPFSPANPVDSKTSKYFQCDYDNPLEVPIYAVFALKYQDKKDLSKRWFFQIWSYKTTEAWVGVKTGNPPPRFFDASDEEKKEICIHLNEELKDYCK